VIFATLLLLVGASVGVFILFLPLLLHLHLLILLHLRRFIVFAISAFGVVTEGSRRGRGGTKGGSRHRGLLSSHPFRLHQVPLHFRCPLITSYTRRVIRQRKQLLLLPALPLIFLLLLFFLPLLLFIHSYHQRRHHGEERHLPSRYRDYCGTIRVGELQEEEEVPKKSLLERGREGGQELKEEGEKNDILDVV